MMKKLLLPAILCIVALQLPAKSQAGLLWSHECVDCHNLGRFENIPHPDILNYSASETVCLSCHDGLGAHEVAPHTNGSTFHITCTDCHDVHQSRSNYLGGLNVMMLGFGMAGETVIEDLFGTNGIQPLAYEERTGPRAFANNGLSDGGVRICEACHPISGTAAHVNPEGTDCRGCHRHDNSFIGTTPWTDPGVGSCNSCHDAEPLTTGTHDRHIRTLGYDCMLCHYDVVFTPDNTLISNGEQHKNGSPSVQASPAEPFDYDYDIDTCSNFSCHNDEVWGMWSITPYFTFDLVDQGDYGVTATALAPACNRAGASDPTVCPPPYTYVWDFSDGYSETTTDPSIHYEFGVPGPHDFTLTLIASNTYQGSRSSGPFNPNPPPPPTPEYYPEATVIGGRTVEVSITTTFGIGTIHVYWGDSQSSQTSGAPVQHTYSSAGTYNIRVLVYDPGHITYEYEYNVWPPTQSCATCPTLQVTVN